MKNNDLKIVMLLSRIDQSGLTTNTIDLLKGLTDLGYTILLITGGVSDDEKSERVFDFQNQILALGVTIRIFKKPRGNIFQKTIKTGVDLINMLWVIRKFNPNVIHSQSPYMTFIPWLLRKKFTTTIHQMGLKRNMFFKTPTHIIAISEESKKDSIENYGMDESQVTIIHHGVQDSFASSISQDEMKKLKLENNIPLNKIILGSVSILTKRKGIDVIVNALQQLSDEAKSKIHFIFLGDDINSQRAQELYQMIKKSGIGDFTSHIAFQNPKPFYDIMDIFILASRQESFPLVTLEAMMSGCCTVRSNTEGAYEQITSGVNGVLFKNENHLELRDTLEQLILNDSMRTTYAKRAKETALKRFTIAKMTENTLKVYDRIRIH